MGSAGRRSSAEYILKGSISFEIRSMSIAGGSRTIVVAFLSRVVCHFWMRRQTSSSQETPPKVQEGILKDGLTWRGFSPAIFGRGERDADKGVQESESVGWKQLMEEFSNKVRIADRDLSARHR